MSDAPNGALGGTPNGAAADDAAGGAVLEYPAAARVVPVVRASTPGRPETAVRRPHGAGPRCFEIASTTPDAPAPIRALASDPALSVGAGAVADADAARACLGAGARSIAAPRVDPMLADSCRDAGAVPMPGAVTPTEVRVALAAGADAAEIVPAASAGRPGHTRAPRGVFPGVAFCPMGGIEANEVHADLEAGARFVGPGGAPVSERRIAAGDRAAIPAVAERVL